MPEITVLGPVGVRRGGAAVDLGARLQRLLAVLVVADGSVVSVDRLVEVVWEGDAPRRPESTLRSYVTRLRQALDPDRDLIPGQRPGYRLDLEALELDADRFDEELAQASAHLRAGDASTAVSLLSSGLARWSGPALADLADEEWARPVAVRLDERRIEAREALVEARLAEGLVDVAIADARELSTAEPLRERPRELLMRALYQSGRQAEALREFTSYRRFLADETGLEPSEDLAGLEGQIARGDASARGVTRTVGTYEIAERIGEGAYSVVHRAVQTGLEREVAVKIIRPELADLPDFVRRFALEAQTIARIEHPNVVPLFDFWREPGAAYLVMRLLRGGTVAEVLRARGPLSRERTAQILTEVGGALGAAHRAGVVHRDVRPANLLFDEQGTAYLTDFGIALPTAAIDDLPIISPAYAAPELLRGEPAGVQADVLSLGVSVFEMLTGRLPFDDSSDRTELVRRQLSEPLPLVRATRPDLPPEIDEILARATAKVANDRYSTVAALVADLRDVLDDAPVTQSGRVRQPARAGTEVRNPYVGLHAFAEQDADRFHGRESLVGELVDAVELHRLVVAVGPSGSGKSSVVRAGLLPAIRRGAVHGSEDWYVTTMVPGTDPIDAFEAALLRVAVNPPASLREQLAESGGLLRAIRRVLPDERSQILIVVDQLEELFTQVSSVGERDRFLSELAAAISAHDSPLRVVATLRADHYDAPLRHRAIADLVTRGTVTVRPMAPDELERAIAAPAASVGVEVEPALVAELVAGVDERPAALPLLQFSLTELFERRAGDLMLLDAHRELGGLAGAVAARADRIVDTGGPDDEAEVRRIFGRLVTVGDAGDDVRRRALRSEFGHGERTAWLLDAFVTARLLSTDRDAATRAPTVEVAHEALLRDWPRLRAWLDEDRADLRVLHQIAAAADAWEAVERDPGELARGGRLAAAGELATRRPDWLNELENEWITASRAAADAEETERQAREERAARQNRRLRGLLVAAAVLLVVALGAALVALVSRGRADDARAEAEVERLAALEAQGRAEDAGAEAEVERLAADEARSEAEAEELAADEARDRAEDARAEAEAERLIARSAAEVVAEPDRGILLALAAHQRRADASSLAAVHAAIAAEPRLVSIHPDPFGGVSSTRLSSDGSTGVSASSDGEVRWFDASTGELSEATYDAGGPIAAVAISGDGELTAIVPPGGPIVFLDRDGGVVGSFALDGSSLVVPSLDADGDTFTANIAQSATMVIVDVPSGTVRAEAELDIDLPAANFADLSPGGDVLAVGANPPGGPLDRSAVMLFDTSTGALIDRWDTDHGTTSAVALSDEYVASGHDDGTVAIRGLGETEAVEIPAHAGEIETVAVLADGRVVSSGGGEVRLFSADGTSLATPLRTTARVASLAETDDGRLAIARVSEGLLVADLGGGALIDKGYPEAAGAQISPYRSFYDAPDPDLRGFRLVDLESGELVRQFDMREVHGTEIGPPFFSTDGEWVMTYEQGLGPDSPFVFTEVAGERQYVFEPSTLRSQLLGEAADQATFASYRPEAGGERIFGMALSATGPTRAGWFDLSTGMLLGEPVEIEFGGRVLLLADGRVAVGSFFAAPTARSAPIGILPADLAGPMQVVEGTGGLQLYHEDRETGRLVVGGPGGRVGIVDPDALEFTPLEGVTGTVIGAAFSPDGARVAVLSAEEGVQLFDATTLDPIGVAFDLGLADQNFAPEVRWSPDGSGVWVSPSIGPIRIVADPERWVEIACEMVNRELTAEEWATFVSPDNEPVPACTGG